MIKSGFHWDLLCLLMDQAQFPYWKIEWRKRAEILLSAGTQWWLVKTFSDFRNDAASFLLLRIRRNPHLFSNWFPEDNYPEVHFPLLMLRVFKFSFLSQSLGQESAGNNSVTQSTFFFLTLRQKVCTSVYVKKNEEDQSLETSAHFETSSALLPPLILLTASCKCITSWHLLVRGTSKGHVIWFE